MAKRTFGKFDVSHVGANPGCVITPGVKGRVVYCQDGEDMHNAWVNTGRPKHTRTHAHKGIHTRTHAHNKYNTSRQQHKGGGGNGQGLMTRPWWALRLSVTFHDSAGHPSCGRMPKIIG